MWYISPVLGLFLAASAVLATNDPIIKLGYTSLRGNATLPNVHFFGGIPYVRPPVGDLRFRAPVRLDETPKSNPPVLDLRNWGPICIQQPAVIGIGYEDCLTLNIWKPPNATASSKLPVVLYIHGGGHYYNSAQGFPMNDWVTTSNGSIVAVSLQYRLGLLGFLASSQPSFISSEGGVLNNGLLDQREALAWIQRNIAKFGGDPQRVTIAGESSGGADVVFHMTAYGGNQSLFRGVIAQSIGTDPTYNTTEYEACYQGVLAHTGCTNLSCLRTASLSTLVAAVNLRGTCRYGPVVDGAMVPDYPSRLITSPAKFNEVTKHVTGFMGGQCTDDGAIFVGNPATFQENETGFVAAIKARYYKLSNSTVEKMIELYPASEFSSQWERAKVAFGDTVFTCQDYTIAQAYTAAGKSQAAYNYRFNTPDPVQLAANPWKGVMHTSDLYFLFDGTNSGPSSANALGVFHAFNATEAPLAQETVSAWIAFAKSLDPSPALQWTPAGVNGTRWVFQEGGVGSTMTASFVEGVTAAHAERCAFWAGVSGETGI
ncbi:hypothetical protein FRB94_008427 [Tulasnella sp. JGI-2019a]|nr:hypothetical protein FRB93_007259 [Tulasnella sp. JGI-2019a]KAG8996278.1 hypothetical protein FRB94_008427 [Tulasnella sp. JGI-2019a]